MKSIIQYLFIAIIATGTLSSQKILAKNSKSEIVLPEKLQVKINKKVADMTKLMSKDLNLSDKQFKKIEAIKLAEAIAIEGERSQADKSQLEIKNEIILINNEANKKILKVLKKDQDVLFEAKKSEYKYSPGMLENLKDLYKDTKENIKEKLGIK